MDFRDVLLVLHIAGAGTWLGTNVVQAVAPGLTARQSAEAAAAWYRVSGKFNRIYNPAAILILVTGILLVIQNDAYTFGSLFVTIGFGMVVLGALFGIFVFTPGGEQTAQAIESGDPSQIKKAVARLTRFGTVDTLLLLFTITAMVLRLGA